jgi:hypothetical protein
MADVVTLGSRRQQDVRAWLVDRRSRRTQATNCCRQVVQRRQPVARRVLDRQSGDARCDAAPDTLSHVLRFAAVPGHEVCVDRHVYGRRDAGDIGQVPIPTENALLS